MRALGAAPVERNRSEPFFCDNIDNSASISMAESTREALDEQIWPTLGAAPATMIDPVSPNHAQD
jgi:hypothetical protein